MIKLWIDDVRPAPDGYVWCKSVEEAKTAISRSVFRLAKSIESGNPDWTLKIELIDLDHDAGDYGPPDYIRIFDWLEETGHNYPIRIHSANVVGVENMRRIIQRNGWKEVF